MTEEEIVITEVEEITQTENNENENNEKTNDKPKKKKNAKIKKIIGFVIIFFILGCAVTALSAVLPKLPYTFTSTDQIEKIEYGFPLSFAVQTRSSDQISELVNSDFNKNVNKQFILPRYDLYDTEWNIGRAAADVFINTAIVAIVVLFFTFFPRVAKKTAKYLIFGLLVCLVFCLLPAMPGTFTIDDLEPMHFGFPLKYLEQTPDVNTIKTNESLDTILKQTFLSPNLLNSDPSRTTTHFVAYKLILSIALNAFLIAAVVNLITVLKILVNGGRKDAILSHYTKSFDTLVLRPLDKKKLLPESVVLRLNERTEKLKLSEKSHKALTGKKKNNGAKKK